MADSLITVQEFNEAVRAWGEAVRAMSVSNVQGGTHETGNLAKSIVDYEDSLDEDKPIYKVAFRFPRYGVFRAYGAGRGYKVVNGRPVKLNTAAEDYKPRETLDWLDKVIQTKTEQLADKVQEYYGDKAMRAALKAIDNSKIIK